MQVKVECYAGYRGEQTPQKFSLNSKKFEVIELLDQWLSPDHRYFKVRADDKAIYILRHDPHGNLWELSFYKNGKLGF